MKIAVSIPFETPPEQPIELAAYLSDRSGAVVAAVPLKDGRAELELDEARARNLSISVAPVRKDLGQKPPTRGQLEPAGAYEPTFTLDPKRQDYRLPSVPDSMLGKWRLCSCRVRGRVVKPVTSGGVTVD